MFLPTTKAELAKLGWGRPDVILVTGDTYIDSAYIGVAVIGRALEAAGFRVAVIAQPDDKTNDISRLGEPKLFWGVTGGSVDSLVANYTATLKRRKSDDFTPGGENNRRPDRATIAYSNLIRRYFKNTVPIVLGGIEASLRRIAHYDYWSNKVRKSILFDAKADFLVYGMGEATVRQLAKALRDDGDVKSIHGLSYIAKEPPEDYTELPSFEDVKSDKAKFIEAFRIFNRNNDPLSASGLFQRQDTRYLVQNPPPALMTTAELDQVFEHPYENDVHPYYKAQGVVRALDTIKYSITTHRGCYGECNFCAIAIHQGKTVVSRSEASILREAEGFARDPKFTGVIRDVGGPTANMYGFECERKLLKGSCAEKRCLYPKVCKKLLPNHSRQINLLRKLRQINGVRKVFVASGIRPDVALGDKQRGRVYIEEIVRHHVSGQLKLAPEHSDERVLKAMGKPGSDSLLEFRKIFNEVSKKVGKKQFLTYYLIAAHPGCSEGEMRSLHGFVRSELRLMPEQVQVFTPLPLTWSGVMYYTEQNPFTGEQIFVEKSNHRKQLQKEIITGRGR